VRLILVVVLSGCVGYLIRRRIRPRLGQVTVMVLAALFIYVVFDALRLRQYLQPRPIREVLVALFFFEFFPWLCFTIAPMVLGYLLASALREAPK
jgi:predicted branched-subunit amino acid permease